MRAEGRRMSVELSERDRDTDNQERRERIRECTYKWEYERCMTEDVPVYLGRESVQMWERREREQVLDGRRREKVQDVPRGETETIEHIWSVCGEMRERGGKVTGRNTERRRKEDRMDERHMEEERKDRKRKGWGIGKNVNFLELYFYVCNQESESPQGK
jgi:hypothetical protein